MKRTAFFVSDSTGITAEILGNSLLAQFEGVHFDKHTVPYLNNTTKAQALVERINRVAERDGLPPIIFDTIIDSEIRRTIASSTGFTIDIFASFLAPLERALQAQSTYTVGRSHSTTSDPAYRNRINAVHYALDSDDGGKLSQYEKADLILTGVSRSGKTPTCLYLAMQFGIYVANYPITEDDFDSANLPQALRRYRDKLYAMTIDPERLSAIRNERRPDTRYASLRQCEDEVRQAEAIFSRFRLPVVNVTEFSIEEIATRILDAAGIERRLA